MMEEEDSSSCENQSSVPEPALRWMLLHATASNVELARLSNVCKKWREIISMIILEQATFKSEPSSPLLLLPSMVSEMIRTPSNSEENSKQSEHHPDETYCAAWFASEGVQVLDLDREDDNLQETPSEPFAPGGGVSYPASDDEKYPKTDSSNRSRPSGRTLKQPKAPMVNIQNQPRRLEQVAQQNSWARGHGPGTKAPFSDRGIFVTHEWRGYRLAMEVLRPFGYANLFVGQVLNQAKELAKCNNGKEKEREEDHHDITQPTIAVRGATIARPEGYCLCWELPSQLPPMIWSNTSNHDEEVLQTVRWQERQRKLKQWKERRRKLQLTVLPQVIVRSPPAKPVVQFLNSNEKNAVRLITPKFPCGPICEPVTILVVGIATEDGCFCSGLNHRFELGHLYPDNAIAELSEMSPICIATDPWECSESHPKTIVPGQQTPLENLLSSRHDSDDDSEDEYSHDSSSDFEHVGDDNSTRQPKKSESGWLSNCTCIFQDYSNPCGFNDGKQLENSGRNEDEDMSETAREDDDEDELGDNHRDRQENAERILRGGRVPGMWHCYTSVFDGARSTIRVDGIPELLSAAPEGDKTVLPNDSNTKPSSSQSNIPTVSPNSVSHAGRNREGGKRAMLDGLTIGSDHSFDMTLCFGQGSGGEGEGAIAEVVVFAGRIDEEDLQVLEQQLMRKHGILPPKTSRETLVMEDRHIRNAHALYCQMPPEAAQILRHRQSPASLEFSRNSIPLRVMAKHRSVAWHQYNSVTGEELRIKRIGSRSGGSSSDW